jgi:hypothetical protein
MSELDHLGYAPMFLGVETQGWNIDQFVSVAKYCKSVGLTSLLIKIADGSALWYGNLGGWTHVLDTIESVGGMKTVPYTYSYGKKYNALQAEINILIDAMHRRGIVIADMESEWNGQTAWASIMAQELAPIPGLFGVSTWADPSIQNWHGVLTTLRPCVNFWMPQVYSDFLAKMYQEEFSHYKLPTYPTLNLGQDAGPNNVLATANAAKSGCISFWEYQGLAGYLNTVKTIIATLKKQQEDNMIYQQLQIADVGNFFDEVAQGWQLKKDTSIILGGAHLNYYRWNSGISDLGLPRTNEMQVDPTNHPECVVVIYERGVTIFDPNYVYDHPPVFPFQPEKRVYPVKIDSGIGQQLIASSLMKPLQDQVAALTKQLQQSNAAILTQALTSIQAMAAHALGQ